MKKLSLALVLSLLAVSQVMAQVNCTKEQQNLENGIITQAEYDAKGCK